MRGHGDRIRTDLDPAHSPTRIGDLPALAPLHPAVATRATTVMDLELGRLRLDPWDVGLILTRLPFQAHSSPAVRTNQRAVDRDLLVVTRKTRPLGLER